MNFPTCFFGKLIIHITCFQSKSSCEYSSVICEEVFLIQISSPKSTQILKAGFLASGKSSTFVIVPERSSTISKSFHVISFITIYLIIKRPILLIGLYLRIMLISYQQNSLQILLLISPLFLKGLQRFLHVGLYIFL